MFTQLFFVLLALILINFTPEIAITYWIVQPLAALQWGFLAYILLLAFLFCQSKFLAILLKMRWQSLWWTIVNIELLLFLAFYHFGLGAHRWFKEGVFATYESPFALTSLAMYFLALGWAFLWHAYFGLRHSFKKSFKTAYQQVLFYCPFCLPYIVLSFLLDGFEHIQFGQNEIFSFNGSWTLFLLGLLFMGVILLFLPPLMIFCWRCKPLSRMDIKERLEKRCEVLKFRHAGLKIWTTLPNSFTAGIIGIAPAFRYILFTPQLLKRFKTEEIEAILIHEIGHNRHRHLLFYPFIVLGMLISGTLLLIGIEYFFSDFLNSQIDDFSLMIGMFILYACMIGGYFRLVFGFFSRLFERQADLYIFETSLSPIFLIQAFDHLGVLTGYSHDHPSWHHFSLQERMHFIEQAMDTPNLIELHHRRVKKWLFVYFTALLASSLALYWMINL